MLTIIISFTVYTIATVIVGILSLWRSKNTNLDFYLAGREHGAWLSAFSACASAESGWVILGLVGFSFTEGVSAAWVLPGCIAGYIFNWTFIAPKLRRLSHSSNSVTLPDFLASRLDGKNLPIRIIAVVIISISMIIYVAGQMNAAGKAFNAVFGLDYIFGVLAGTAIILIYSICGGYRAVAWTDLIQGALMVFSLIFIPIFTLLQVGGFLSLAENLASQDTGLLSITSKKTGLALVGMVAGLSGIGLGYPGLPHVLIRFMSAKDEKSIWRGRIIATTWVTVVLSGAILTGMTTRAIYQKLPDAEQALPIFAVQFLPGALSGLILAAILAAMCSTADSQLLVAASSIAHDIIHKVFGKELKPSTLSWINRLTVGVLGILSAGLAISNNRGIFSFILYVWSMLGASFGPVVILSLWWKKLSKAGMIAGMLTGTIVTVIWRLTDLSAFVYELVPAFVLAFIFSVIFSLALPDQKSETNPNKKIPRKYGCFRRLKKVFRR